MLTEIKKVNFFIKLATFPLTFLVSWAVTAKYGGKYWEYWWYISKQWFIK